MILLNAIYFAGKWAEKFAKNNSRAKTFYNYNDKSKAKQFERMSIKEDFLYYSNKELKWLNYHIKKIQCLL